ncbi:MAG: efflux RND transporter periplasmic adaptor subunit [Nitrospinae bacterium]|nr:efflux RND transporter periplasmic adaptor subunit [Nitrospinota bacterium]
MKLNKKIAPFIFLIAALGIGGFVWFKWLNNDGNRRIIISGNIELTEVNIAFKTSGKLIEMSVKEGDSVKKGMALARLDSDQLIHQQDRAKAVLSSSESKLTQLQTAIRFDKENIQGQIEQRKAELKQAESKLQELLTGSRLQEIEQAKAAANRARIEYEWAKRDWERAQTLLESKNISVSQYDQFKTRFESAEASLKQSEENLKLVVEGPRKENIEEARAQVDRAKAGLRLAEALRIELQRKEQEIKTYQAEIDRSRAELSLIDSQLSDTAAISPIDGVVLVKAAEAGEVLSSGTTVVAVGDLSHPWLRGYIGEQDLGRVKLGMKVRVKTDSFPDKVYWGKLSFISPEAEFTPKQIQTQEERVKLVYRIKIDIENPNHELKLNMPADAEIMINE